MRTIQEVGTEILTKNPKKFYVMVGTEYGIKKKYIKILEDFYGSLQEYPNVSSILELMSKRQLIPLQPSVYVVRYDEDFIAGLKEGLQKRIDSMKIVGTIVCIYDQPKHAAKLDKFLPDYTVSVDAVSHKFLNRYLHSDFPGLADNLIDLAVDIADDYNQAQNLCYCMSLLPAEDLVSVGNKHLSEIFGYKRVSEDEEIKKGIAAKNFKYLMNKLSTYQGSYDAIVYAIMNTMVELDKISANKHTESTIRQYLELWTGPDIYYMFVHAYNELKRMRSAASFADPEDSIVYLFSLLTFRRIPSEDSLL